MNSQAVANLIAAMGISARIEAMKITNTQCAFEQQSPAYKYDDFAACANDLDMLARDTRENGWQT